MHAHLFICHARRMLSAVPAWNCSSAKMLAADWPQTPGKRRQNDVMLTICCGAETRAGCSRFCIQGVHARHVVPARGQPFRIGGCAAAGAWAAPHHRQQSCCGEPPAAVTHITGGRVAPVPGAECAIPSPGILAETSSSCHRCCRPHGMTCPDVQSSAVN